MGDRLVLTNRTKLTRTSGTGRANIGRGGTVVSGASNGELKEFTVEPNSPFIQDDPNASVYVELVVAPGTRVLY